MRKGRGPDRRGGQGSAEIPCSCSDAIASAKSRPRRQLVIGIELDADYQAVTVLDGVTGVQRLEELIVRVPQAASW